MATIEKIIMVDRVLEKLTDDEMAIIKKGYADYCTGLYSFVNDVKMPDKDARIAMFSAMLSPYQYFIEDYVRLKRLKEGKLEGAQAAPAQVQTLRGPAPGGQAYRPKWKKY